MGQKVNPNGLRLGINRDWSSHWYADKKVFASYLKQDIAIRNYLESMLNGCDEKKVVTDKLPKKVDAGLSRVDIDRVKDSIKVTLLVAHPADVLGADGANLKALKAELVKKAGVKDLEIAIVEVKNPDLDAVLVAKDMAKQLQQRASYRVVQKKAIQRVLRAGAKGCKTMTKGRIGGAEIARTEEYREGVLGLHTLRQPIDYAYIPCHTTYGVIGVKVWIALPDNYQELRDRKPEEGRDNRRRFNGNRRGNNRGPRPAVAAPANDGSKGE